MAKDSNSIEKFDVLKNLKDLEEFPKGLSLINKSHGRHNSKVVSVVSSSFEEVEEIERKRGREKICLL